MVLVSFTSLVCLSSRTPEHFRVTTFPPDPAPPPGAAASAELPSPSPPVLEPRRSSPPRLYHAEAVTLFWRAGEGGGDGSPPSLKFLRKLLTPSSSRPQRVSWVSVDRGARVYRVVRRVRL